MSAGKDGKSFEFLAYLGYTHKKFEKYIFSFTLPDPAGRPNAILRL